MPEKEIEALISGQQWPATPLSDSRKPASASAFRSHIRPRSASDLSPRPRFFTRETVTQMYARFMITQGMLKQPSGHEGSSRTRQVVTNSIPESQETLSRKSAEGQNGLPDAELYTTYWRAQKS